MKNISRESIQRMVGGVNSIIGGGAGGGGDMAGYATEMWVEDKYVNKEFFSSLFKAYDANGNEVLPNDTETTIDNIKAMFGFWTDFYISALGTGGQQSVDLRLAQLADVNVAGVTDGQVLTYDTTSGKWIASTPQAGTDMATVWANLAASGNQQINYTHISNAVKISNGTITIGSSSITPLTSHQSVTDHNPTLSWSTKSKVATIGSTEIHVTMLAKPSYTLDDVSDGSSRKLSNYLPLSGGTMSGTLGLKSKAYGGPSGDHGMNCNNSDIVGVNSIYTADISGGWDEGIEFKRTNNNWDSMYAIDGTFYFKANNNGGGATLNVGNLYSAGYVTALSDARHKNVIGDTELTVEQIAGAPAIRFQWNDRDDKTVFAGSIAQYWQKVLPEVVQSQADGTLSLDYQVAALISSITVARKVMNHESRLQRLERMFAINEDDIED